MPIPSTKLSLWAVYCISTSLAADLPGFLNATLTTTQQGGDFRLSQPLTTSAAFQTLGNNDTVSNTTSHSDWVISAPYHCDDIVDFPATCYEPVLKVWTTEGVDEQILYQTSVYVFCGTSTVTTLSRTGFGNTSLATRQSSEYTKLVYFASRNASSTVVSEDWLPGWALPTTKNDGTTSTGPEECRSSFRDYFRSLSNLDSQSRLDRRMRQDMFYRKPQCTMTTVDCQKCTIIPFFVMLYYFPPATSISKDLCAREPHPLFVHPGHNDDDEKSVRYALSTQGTEVVVGNETTTIIKTNTFYDNRVYLRPMGVYAANSEGCPTSTTWGGIYYDKFITMKSHQVSTLRYPNIDFTAYPLNYADLEFPHPLSAWRGIEECAFGEECNISKTYYHGQGYWIPPMVPAVISLPEEIKSFDADWKDCGLHWQGLMDPPEVLTAVGVTTLAHPMLHPTNVPDITSNYAYGATPGAAIQQDTASSTASPNIQVQASGNPGLKTPIPVLYQPTLVAGQIVTPAPGSLGSLGSPGIVQIRGSRIGPGQSMRLEGGLVLKVGQNHQLTIADPLRPSEAPTIYGLLRPGEKPPEAIATIGNTPVMQFSGNLQIGDHVLRPGDPGFVVDGTSVSLGVRGLSIGGSSSRLIPLTPNAQGAAPSSGSTENEIVPNNLGTSPKSIGTADPRPVKKSAAASRGLPFLPLLGSCSVALGFWLR